MRVILALSLLAPAPVPSWQVVQRVPDGTFHPRGVEAAGPKDAWAFGGRYGEKPLMRRWNGRSWKAFPLPKAATGMIGEVSAVSPREVWAIGNDERRAYAMRFDGRRWKIVKSWRGYSATDVEAFGPKDVWVALSGGFLHFDGRLWKRTGSRLEQGRLAGTSAGNLWAIGEKGNASQILRRTSRGWKRAVPKALPRAVPHIGVPGSVSEEVRLLGLTAPSARDVWVTGEIWHDIVNGGDSDPVDEIIPFVLHWNGRSWTRENLPKTKDGDAGRISPDGRGGYWWATMDDAHDIYGPSAARLFHRTKTGRWRERRAPRGLVFEDFATVPGSRAVWALGMSYKSGEQAILRSGK